MATLSLLQDIGIILKGCPKTLEILQKTDGLLACTGYSGPDLLVLQ